MNSPALPNAMFVHDDHKRKAINTLDAVQNLLYLIRVDASDPSRVRGYVDQADELLSKMQNQMLSDH